MQITNNTSKDIVLSDVKVYGDNLVAGRIIVPAGDTISVPIKDFLIVLMYDPNFLGKVSDGSLTIAAEAYDTAYINRLKSFLSTLGISW